MGRSRWHLVSNHGAVLIYLSAHPAATMRETAAAVGMSQRRVAGIVRELADAGMLAIEKSGNRNRYRPDVTARFPFAFLSHLPVGLMLTPVVEALREEGAVVCAGCAGDRHAERAPEGGPRP